MPMLMSSRSSIVKKQGRGGRASVENSFEEESNMKKLQEKQALAIKIKEGSALQKELRNNRKQGGGLHDGDIDPELVQTYEEFQQTRYSSRIGKYPHAPEKAFHN